MAEITPRSVGWGLCLCVVFTIASAYSGLKVGQVLEAAIPISNTGDRTGAPVSAAIDAAGKRDHHRHRRPGGIGGGRGHLHASGSLHTEARPRTPYKPSWICLAADAWGVLFLIPLRRYFVRDMHGLLPYPEADRHHGGAGHGRRKADRRRSCCWKPRPSPASMIFSSPPFTFGKSTWISCSFPPWRTLAERARWCSDSTPSASSWARYVMGCAASLILCAGGVLSNLVLVPLIWMIGSHISTAAVIRRRCPSPR